ncbi:PKD domain-containing protein [Echinicola shivajiensis]|uniref:PKD domain-containing protein n=1 Tax=Echinicola shivajiensis TaxID=1035916 RepID=UPI001BFC2481|nr:PKD domain-containing protein [Echinicola shivajiensis]
MKVNIIKSFALSVAVLLNLFGCISEDDTDKNEPVADFEFEISEGKVEFINKSINADIFLWEFGDAEDSESVMDNPSFEYTRPGSYDVTVTLKATNSETGKVSTVSKEVSLIDIPASIAIDGDFTDWGEIPFLEDVTGDGSIEKIKVDGSGDLISVYIEGNSDLSLHMPEWAVNTDGDISTGFVNDNFWLNTGFDILGSDTAHGLYTRKDGAESSEWKWTWQSEAAVWWYFSEKKSLGNGKVGIEMGLSKSEIQKFATLSDEGVYMVITDWGPQWDLRGRIPAKEAGQSAIYVKF